MLLSFGEQAQGNPFVSKRFKILKKKEIFDYHQGGPNGAHNQAYQKCQTLLNQKQHIETLESFNFAFKIHLMRDILGITNDLSKAVQRNDQDIVNAMKLVRISKKRLQMIRDDGCDSLILKFIHFMINMKLSFQR